jgi:hypothetical protein
LLKKKKRRRLVLREHTSREDFERCVEIARTGTAYGLPIKDFDVEDLLYILAKIVVYDYDLDVFMIQDLPEEEKQS